MSTVNNRRQKSARRVLDDIFSNEKGVLVIHYSCESFYDRPEGTSPRITSIAIRRLESGQTVSFSIHQVAERNSHDLARIDEKYDAFELEMLKDYFAFVDKHQENLWLHWNMRDINYGFMALEHRFGVLGGTPLVLADSQKIDLARLLIDLFGVQYAGHPRLES